MGRGFKKPEKLTTRRLLWMPPITEWLLFLRSLRYCAIRLIMCWKLIFTNHFVRITTSYIWYSKCWMMIWLGTNWSSYFLSGNWWTNSFWLALEIHHGTVLQDGQFAALRNKYRFFWFSSNFNDFLQTKPSNLWIFDYFSNRIDKMLIS